MEYLQYFDNMIKCQNNIDSFKPYYKWNTFNTIKDRQVFHFFVKVLNLIINGIPSILNKEIILEGKVKDCFKPYYKWNTFNTYISICNR